MISSYQPSDRKITHPDVPYLLENFCGLVLTNLDHFKPTEPNTIIYAMGNIEPIYDCVTEINVIKEFSYNYNDEVNLIDAASLPLIINNVGVYFRNFFVPQNYFDLLQTAHEFQNLTESNKEGTSFRKGLYISKVTDDFQFHLLRYSTNLSGPTENFRDIDHYLVDTVNKISDQFFTNPAELNHILAQIYENNIKKARILSLEFY